MASNLPDVTLQINDGALGITGASSENIQAIIGVCTSGTANTVYSFGDLKTLTNTLVSGPAVKAAAHSLAVAGGSVFVVPINASVAGTAPTLTQTGTGTGLVTAPVLSSVVASGTSPPTVTVSGTPVEADAGVIQVSITTGGSVGTAAFTWTLNGVTQATGVATASTVALGATGITLHFATGTYGTDNVYTLAATAPNDGYEVIVQIVTGGVLGATTFKYALDSANPAGPSYGSTIAAPSATSPYYLIPGTGITLVFTTSGTYVAGDTFAGKSTAPGYTTTDLNNALTALMADARTWNFVQVVGQASSVGSSAAMAAILDTALQSAAGNFRFVEGVMQCANDTDTNIIAGFAGFASNFGRVSVAVGTEDLVDVLTGRVLTMDAAIPACARLAAIAVHVDPGRVADGSLPGVVKLNRDELATPGLDAQRFLTLRSIIGRSGAYITKGRTMAPQGSDFSLIQYARLMNKACGYARIGMLQFLNDSVRVNANGTIYELDARRIETYLNAILNANLVQTGNCTSVSCQVSRVQNVLSTQTLPVKVRVLPLGYLSFITVDIGFQEVATTLAALA